jgi:sensor histidine kinase YesM
LGIALYYFNSEWLVPKTIFKGKQRLFILGGVLCVFILVLFGLITGEFLNDSVLIESNNNLEDSTPPRNRVVFLSIFFGTLIIAVGTSNKLIERWKKEQDLRQVKQKEQLRTQLELLKNQINPHFFFNTLNNIYSLIEIDPSKAQESIKHLSKLMRYHLYKTDVEKVSLKDEVQFLKDYLELMKIRINEKVRLSVVFNVKDENVKIPPLLFEPLVENSFKHGISYSKASFIAIELNQGDSFFELIIKNSDHSQSLNKEKGGVGLSNIEQRLNLIYGEGNYNFTYGASESRFSSELKIPIE